MLAVSPSGIPTRLTFMFAPLSIAGCFVMNPSQESKIIQGNLLGLDPKLLVELPLRCSPHALDRLGKFRASLAGNAQRVRAASVCPHVRKGDLFRGSLLEKKLIIGIEEEDREGAM